MGEPETRHGCTPAPCLVRLRDQVDALHPHRSRASDGICGDPAHQARVSDHNRGEAIDITHDPLGGVDAGWIAEEARRQMAASPGTGRLSLIIWNRRRASAATGWGWVAYHGTNPHTGHVHLSIRTSARDVIRRWSIVR